jgi:hypothetical protein
MIGAHMPAPTIPVFTDLARPFDALINMTAPSWRDVGAVAPLILLRIQNVTPCRKHFGGAIRSLQSR